MTAENIAVTLPSEMVAAARRAVAQGRAASVSAYIAESLARREREDALAALLDEMDAYPRPPQDRPDPHPDHHLTPIPAAFPLVGALRNCGCGNERP